MLFNSDMIYRTNEAMWPLEAAKEMEITVSPIKYIPGFSPAFEAMLLGI